MNITFLVLLQHHSLYFLNLCCIFLFVLSSKCLSLSAQTPLFLYLNSLHDLMDLITFNAYNFQVSIFNLHSTCVSEMVYSASPFNVF